MIQVSHLTKQYGPRTAVYDLSFSVESGEIMGFLGPNGAGKSTTMKILTGFMPATSGEVSVAGFDVYENSLDVKKNVGYLPETPPVYTEMVVKDYLLYAAKLHGVAKKDLKKSVDAALEKTSLFDVQKRLIGNLSKGYRQRVGLAQALVHNPKVLILDEPTVGLDPKQIIEIRDLIRGLRGEHTVILSSHILPEVTATCSRIIVINKGKIVATDTIESLTSRMKGTGAFHLSVKNPNESGLKALREISGVEHVEKTEKNIRIQMKDSQIDARDQIVETAVKNQMGVLEFTVDRMSLEEVFVELTTEENLGGSHE